MNQSKGLTLQADKDREFKGLKKLAEYIIKCSACNAPLVNVLITQKTDDDQEIKFRADCPHCGDKSYIKPITGAGWFLGFTDFTEYTDFIDENDVVNIKTVKGAKTWNSSTK